MFLNFTPLETERVALLDEEMKLQSELLSNRQNKAEMTLSVLTNE